MRLPFEEIKSELERVLVKKGFSPERAGECARLFTETHQDGVYSHGLNRFPRFINYIQKGYIHIHAEPTLVAKTGAFERWDGNLGPGNLNAQQAMQRAVSLANDNGIGAVALRNTNHWMRGGTYGWQAADAGCMAICFTNTMPNMPPWGGSTPKLGNNPLILAVPRENKEHIVLDTAMSQFSYGKLQGYAEQNKKLPVPGGFDPAGNLTQDAAAIEASQRALPIGFWKGSGLSLMLDFMAGLLSAGKTTSDISKTADEYGVSQVFICFNPELSKQAAFSNDLINQVIAYTKSSTQANPENEILYPGEHTLKLRKENKALGIPVEENIWETIKSM